MSGHVVAVKVENNQYVQAGTVLVELDPKDYEVAGDRAQAQYADALATAQAARVGVPITSVSTSSQVTTAQAQVENARASRSAAEKEYQAALARIEQAEANNAKAQADLNRYKLLVGKQEISEQQYDQVMTTSKAEAASDGLVGRPLRMAAALRRLSEEHCLWARHNVH